MNTTDEKPPRSYRGRRYGQPFQLRFLDSDAASLAALSAKWGTTLAETLRRALREKAESELS